MGAITHSRPADRGCLFQPDAGSKLPASPPALVPDWYVPIVTPAPTAAGESRALDPSLRRALALAPFVVAVVVAAVAIDVASRVNDARLWVTHTTTLLEHSQKLMISLQDAETGQRAYLLTGDSAYLGPYRSGMAATPREAAFLQDSTADNPGQQDRLRVIGRRIQVKREELALTIRQHDSSGKAAALATVRSNLGEAVMDSLRADVAAFQATERQLLTRRLNVLDSRVRLLALVVLLGSLVTAVVAYLTNRAFSRYAATQEGLALELGEQNQQLNEQALELELQNQQLQEQTAELEMQGEELQTSARRLEAANEELSHEVAERHAAQLALDEVNGQLSGRVTELTSLTRGLEAFSYSVSHDLRAPLGTINGLARLLHEDYAAVLDEAGGGHLLRIAANAVQMGELIDALLEMARVSHGEREHHPIDLSEIADAVVGQLLRGAPERAVTVHVERGLRAFGDPRLVRALLQNLLANAWKFTSGTDGARMELARVPAGEPVPCGIHAADGFVLFVVRDNGPGFDPALASRLFTPFQRLHSAREYEGTGIGLATVERVVQRHGGAVCGSGAVGRGAAFYFTLPSA